MIRNQWYVVLESNEVRPGKPVGVTRMGEKLVFWRDQSGRLGCVADRCPHRGVALSLGKIVAGHLQCPFHGFEFDSSGACQCIPANGKNGDIPKALRVQSYPLQEAHDLVYLWWGEPLEQYPPLPFFESITEDFVFATVRDHWATHYSRAIENQLDAVHLPFIHYNTIGRGNRTLINGPLIHESQQYPGDHLLDMWVYNEKDEGQKPLRAYKLAEPTRRPFLQFRFPNIWQNWISDAVRIFVAFAPIDDENTLMYLRFYHKVKLPILRQVMGWVGNLSNLMIERQDRRVVVTQLPRRSDLVIGEKLIPGDGPIITYRKIRHTLIEEAEPVVKNFIHNG